MVQNILILIGSPRTEKSTSNFISINLEKKLTSQNISYSKLYLLKELHYEEALLEKLANADTVILITPVYENNVPTTVLQFFEMAFKHKELFNAQNKQFFAITLTGFANPAAGKATLNTCKLFTEEMRFSWLGGITTSPATLIDSEELGKMYAGLSTSLNLLAQGLNQGGPLPTQIFELNTKAVFPAWIYRIIGSIIQKKVIKNIGKDAFYAKPFI